MQVTGRTAAAACTAESHQVLQRVLRMHLSTDAIPPKQLRGGKEVARRLLRAGVKATDCGPPTYTKANTKEGRSRLDHNCDL